MGQASTRPTTDEYTVSRRCWWASYLCALSVWTGFAALPSSLLGAMAVVATVLAAGWRRVRWTKTTYALGPLGAYLGLVLLSIFYSTDRAASWDQGSSLWNLLALPLILLTLRSGTWLRKVLDGLSFTGIPISAMALWQVWSSTDPLLGLTNVRARISGPYSHHMTLAGVLLLILVATLPHLRLRRSSWWRWLSVVLMMAALAATLTRSAWLGLFIAALLLAVLKQNKRLFAIPLLALGVGLLAPGLVGERTRTIFDLAAAGDRPAIWTSGVSMIRDHPLWGLGLSQVRARFPEYLSSKAVEEEVHHLHSSLLQIGAETGLLSLAAFFWLIGGSLFTAWRLRREEADARNRDLLLSCVLATAAWLVAGVFEDNWNDTEVQRLLLFFLAVPGCLAWKPQSTGWPSRRERLGSQPTEQSGRQEF